LILNNEIVVVTLDTGKLLVRDTFAANQLGDSLFVAIKINFRNLPFLWIDEVSFLVKKPLKLQRSSIFIARLAPALASVEHDIAATCHPE
jgi:hypothetical protein